MKTNISKIICIILVFCFIFIFTGCGKLERPATAATCILYGNTKNTVTPKGDELLNEIACMADNCVTKCSVITLDGSPSSVSYSHTVKYPDFRDSESKGYLDYSKSEYLTKIVKDIQNDCKPNEEEVDIISGLHYAKVWLSKSDLSKNKIIVYSSGLSTTGVLDFSRNPYLIDEDPKTIIERLKKNSSLPDLTGVEVVWYGFGVVEKPQEKLTYEDQQKLLNIWNSILDACNASGEITVDIGTVYESNVIKDEYPSVSCVNFNK